MIIVDTYEKLSTALEWLHGQEILAYDVETTGLNVRRDSITGFGVSNGVSGCYFPVQRFVNGQLEDYGVGAEAIEHVLALLRGKKLLCWNASFDLRFTKNDFGVDLVPALHADVMLMKHTCDEEFPFGLKEVGVKIYGPEAVQEQTALKASIKANGGTATEFYKAGTDILASYCVKDCLLTYRLFTHYSKELKRQGLENFYYTDEVLPLYKIVTIPLEETGIQLDMPLLKSTLTSYNLNGFPNGGITVDIARLEDSIQCAIAPLLHDVFRPWFLSKDYPLTTYSTKKPSAWTKKYLTQFEAWRAENLVGSMFNLQSKHHLKKLFFDTLNETPLSRTPTGLPQVDEEFLDTMALKYTWAADLITYNKLSKLKGTYIDRFMEDQEDGILYPSFMQHRTVSGRYGSDIQQMPRSIDASSGELVSRYTNIIRSFIVARPGSKLISADYAQLEPRTFCHVSGDEALKDIFVSGQDFYTTVGCKVLKLTELTKKQRQDAKVYALGIPYGLSGYKLQFEIGCTNKEGDKLVADYLNAFPKLKEWMSATKTKAVTEGHVTTQTGRVRHLRHAKALFDKYGTAILDDLQLWHRYHDYPAVYAEAKVARKTFKNLVNNACNFQIQGLAASIINRASIALNRNLKSQNLKARLVAQVHDELILDVPESEVETVAKLVQDAMENTTKTSVPLIAKPVVAFRYSDCK